MTSELRPSVKTSVPGPESVRLNDRAADLLMGIGLSDGKSLVPFVSRYRDGWFLEDVDGNRYLDWVSGWAAAPLGGNHPELVDAAHQAMKEYGTECLSAIKTWHQIEFAEKLTEIAPEPLKGVLFDTTGSEVAENAVRVMREAAGPSRPFVITFLGSFHGGNYGTGAMGPHQPHYAHGIAPFMSGWINVPFPTCYRCPYGLEYPSCDVACLSYIEDLILKYQADPEAIAGVAVELVQGENGVQIPPPEWPGRLSALCKKYGWILYNDEVQEGLGRTGTFFATEHWPEVETELLSLGKGSSGGLIPICYTLGSRRMSEAASRIYTGGTFAGSPVGCAVGLKLIEVIERDEVLANVLELERIAKERFGAMRERYEIVGDVRVIGAYQCVEFVEDKVSKTPAREIAQEINDRMVQLGVVSICEPAFSYIRPTPALNMPPDLFSVGCDILEQAIDDVSRKHGKGIA